MQWFDVVYWQYCLKNSTMWSPFLPTLQCLVFLCCIWAAVPRNSDNLHHWGDIATGVTLGSIVAVSMNVLYVSKLYPASSTSSSMGKKHEEMIEADGTRESMLKEVMLHDDRDEVKRMDTV